MDGASKNTNHQEELKVEKWGRREPKRMDLSKWRGRQPKFGPRKQEQFLTLIHMGNSMRAACKALGISPATVRKFRNSWPEYNREVMKLQEIQVDLIADNLYRVASTTDNVTAMIFFLVNQTMHLPVGDPRKFMHLGKVIHELFPLPDLEAAGDAEAAEEARVKQMEEQMARVFGLLNEYEAHDDQEGTTDADYTILEE
jgi:hypothetical protein